MSHYYRSFLEESGASYSYLFDSVPNSTLAYSLRKLSSTYSGNCMRVRRSSDNAEQNIGFTSNLLDTTSLLSFVGASNGFITTFYDQIGINHLIQVNAVNQPQVVSSGALITKSGKTSIRWDVTKEMSLTTALPSLVNSSYSVFMDYFKATTGNNAIIISGTPTTNYAWIDWNLTQYIGNSTITNATEFFTPATHNIVNTILVNGVSSKVYSNGVQIGTTGNGLNNTALIFDKLFNSGYNRQDTYSSEFIFYGSNQTSNRTLIEINQNNYYAIY